MFWVHVGLRRSYFWTATSVTSVTFPVTVTEYNLMSLTSKSASSSVVSVDAADINIVIGQNVVKHRRGDGQISHSQTAAPLLLLLTLYLRMERAEWEFKVEAPCHPFPHLLAKVWKEGGMCCVQNVYKLECIIGTLCICKACTSDIKLYLGIDQWSCIWHPLNVRICTRWIECIKV